MMNHVIDAFLGETNVWLWAAMGMVPALALAMVASFRGQLGDRLIGLEMTGCLVSIELLLLAQGFDHASLYDLPLTMAFLSFGSGMVFARFVQRWL
jgi:multicomponent Na+:H+ antiporter subunit F